jgi:hypothetical protein
MPPLTLDYHIDTDDGLKYIEKVYVTITDRDQSSLKEYAMPEISAYLYYNKEKQVASMLFECTEVKDDEEPKGSNEVFDTLSTLKDEAALKAYHFAAWYWIAFDSAFAVANGDLLLLDPSSLPDGYAIEEKNPEEDNLDQF